MHRGEWLGGMFDRGSWREYQQGWARTVVTGRARLEGLPVGVLGVESSAVTVRVPADPGMPTSSEQEIVQAGQVREGPPHAYLPICCLACCRLPGGGGEAAHTVVACKCQCRVLCSAEGVAV